MTTTVEIYRKYLFMYGIITILQLLKHFEDDEEYEECEKIVVAIKKNETVLDIKLSTKITEDIIKDCLEQHKGEVTKEWLLETSNYYKKLILDEIR